MLDGYPQALVPSLAIPRFERQRPSCASSTVRGVEECAPVINRPSATAPADSRCETVVTSSGEMLQLHVGVLGPQGCLANHSPTMSLSA